MQWLFIPLRDEDVLVPGERVLYKRRRHWAAILPELIQFGAVLFLHTALSISGTTGLGSVVLLGGIISLIVLRPLVKRDHWDTWQLVLIALVAFWAIQSGISILGFAWLLVLAMAVRFMVRCIRWAIFQRTYLTTRRVMEVDGFFGVTVNSMPISQVTDIMLHRNPLGEMLGYGTFRVESAGQDQALGRLEYLLDPEAFHDLVVMAGRTFRSGPAPT